MRWKRESGTCLLSSACQSHQPDEYVHLGSRRDHPRGVGGTCSRCATCCVLLGVRKTVNRLPIPRWLPLQAGGLTFTYGIHGIHLGRTGGRPRMQAAGGPCGLFLHVKHTGPSEEQRQNGDDDHSSGNRTPTSLAPCSSHWSPLDPSPLTQIHHSLLRAARAHPIQVTPWLISEI